MQSDALSQFVQKVIDNLKRHGFPGRKVAFPIESLYEAADRKGLSFNRVLDVLSGLGVAHEKTPEKVIFYSTAHEEPPSPAGSPFAGLDLSALSGLPREQLLSAAMQAMQQLSPQQLEALRGMMENMSDEQRAEMMEQAKKMGLI